MEDGALGAMKVADVMTKELYAVAPDTSVDTAARLLSQRHITGMPVVDDGGRAIGVVTLADLVDPDRARSNENGYPLFYRMAEGDVAKVGDDVTSDSGRVIDVMCPFVLSIEAGATIVDAANRMVGEGVHRLLVMDSGELVGIVTTTDLLRGFAMMHRIPVPPDTD